MTTLAYSLLFSQCTECSVVDVLGMEFGVAPMNRIACFMLFWIAVSAVGCLYADGDTGATGSGEDRLIGRFAGASVSGNIAVREASLVGAIGEVDQLHHHATRVTADGDDSWITFTVTVDTGEGAAMTILDLWRHSPLDAFDRGLYEPSSQGGALDAFELSVIGCSGPEEGEWSLDTPADDVDWSVSENPANPDELTLRFTAQIADNRGEFWFEQEAAWELGLPAAPQPSTLEPTTVSGSVTFLPPF